jgi:hypothetical protein
VIDYEERILFSASNSSKQEINDFFSAKTTELYLFKSKSMIMHPF